MKINLTNIEIKPTLSGAAVKHNFSKEVAEVIYQQAKTLKEADFAQRLYHSEGDFEIDAQEKEILLTAVSNFLWWAQEPLRKEIENA